MSRAALACPGHAGPESLGGVSRDDKMADFSHDEGCEKFAYIYNQAAFVSFTAHTYIRAIDG